MAGLTYSQLKTLVESYLQNTNWDSTAGGTQFSFILRQAEERINYLVQVQNYNSTTYVGNIDQSAFSTSEGANFIKATDSDQAPLAPLYFKMRDGAGVTSNKWFYLLLKDYNFLQEYAPADGSTGTPAYYSFYYDAGDDNRSVFNFAPYLASSGATKDYEILYFFDPESLVDVSSGSTWLGTHGRTALLYGCLTEAYTFMKGEGDLLQFYDMKFKEALGAMVTAHGGDYRSRSYQGAKDSPPMQQGAA